MRDPERGSLNPEDSGAVPKPADVVNPERPHLRLTQEDEDAETEWRRNIPQGSVPRTHYFASHVMYLMSSLPFNRALGSRLWEQYLSELKPRERRKYLNFVAHDLLQKALDERVNEEVTPARVDALKLQISNLIEREETYPEHPKEEENKEKEAEKIMAAAQAQRRKILRRAVSSMMNFVPGVSAVKMTREAWFGKTAEGRKLTPWGRINHVLVEAINGSAWAVGIFKDPLIGLAMHAVGTSMSGAQYFPEIVKNLAAFLETMRQTEAAEKLEKMKAAIEQGRWRRLYFEGEEKE